MDARLPGLNEGLTHRVRRFEGLDLDQMGEGDRALALVIEDDPDALLLLKLSLRQGGLNVAGALEATEALRKFDHLVPDVVLLDLDLPETSGWTVLERVRRSGRTPVVIVTAESSTEAVVRGLRSGGDDFIIKPFHPVEMVARVRAVLRRAGRNSEGNRYVFPELGLVVDIDRHEVRFQGRRVHLSSKEFELFACLARRAPQPVPQRLIATEVWGEDSVAIRRRIKYLIHMTRRRLRAARAAPGIIHCLPRQGYLLQTSPNPGAA